MTKEQIDSLQAIVDAERAKLDVCLTFDEVHEMTREAMEMDKKNIELDLLKEKYMMAMLNGGEQDD